MKIFLKLTIPASVLPLLAAAVTASASVRYVDVNSTNAQPPFLEWNTAATNIQDAVDVAVAGDEVVVTNGIYAAGGRAVYGTLTNRVAVNKSLTLQSVNGPQFTTIQGFKDPAATNGDGAVRCVYLTNGVSLVGFTLAGGATRTNGGASEMSGGGVWCESTNAVISNCVLVANSCWINGGGTCSGTLLYCVLSSNLTYIGKGGGAYSSALDSCILRGNSSPRSSGGGGGTAYGTVNNCVLFENTATLGGGGAFQGTLTNCILATNNGGGAYLATLNNCTLVANYAGNGGGACLATLNNCTLVANHAGNGGGAYLSTLNHCTLAGNTAGHGLAGEGGGAYRCTLNFCTLTENSAPGDYGEGGGAYQGTLSYCTLSNNVAGSEGGGTWGSGVNYSLFFGNSATLGGGANGGTLNNCLISGNSADLDGGGAWGCTLNHCTVVDNVAWDFGGGVAGSTLFNCIVAYNAAWEADNYGYGALEYCCTTPLPTNGLGNVSVRPMFVDYDHGDLRLQPTSPCINAGNNALVKASADLDGNPRIVSGTVDIGAYEYQGIGSEISYAWLQQYGLPTDGSADSLDSDSDGRNNWQEWRCLTVPTNALSVLHLLPPSFDGTNVVLSWEAVAGVSYFLDCSTNLAPNPSFSSLATNLLSSQSSIVSYKDTNTAAALSRIYRLGVGN
jgi:hypothetical protein